MPQGVASTVHTGRTFHLRQFPSIGDVCRAPKPPRRVSHGAGTSEVSVCDPRDHRGLKSKRPKRSQQKSRRGSPRAAPASSPCTSHPQPVSAARNAAHGAARPAREARHASGRSGRASSRGSPKMPTCWSPHKTELARQAGPTMIRSTSAYRVHSGTCIRSCARLKNMFMDPEILRSSLAYRNSILGILKAKSFATSSMRTSQLAIDSAVGAGCESQLGQSKDSVSNRRSRRRSSA